MVDRAVEKGSVVAGHDQCTRPLVEKALERPQRVEVEIVRGFVENEQVRLGGQHHHELQPSTFASGQHLHGCVLGSRVEPETFEENAVLPVGLAQRARDDLAHDRFGFEQRRLLIRVPNTTVDPRLTSPVTG